MRKLVTALATCAFLVLGTAATAEAAQNSLNHSTIETCTYTVTWADASVYEDEGGIGWIKNKRRGQYVEGPGVDLWVNDAWWTAVYTSEAHDGIGWMRTAALNGCGH